MKTTLKKFVEYLNSYFNPPHVQLMKTAIDSALAGSEPWKVEDIAEAIETEAYTRFQQTKLRRYYEKQKKKKHEDILLRKLVEVAMGQIPGPSIKNSVRTLGKYDKEYEAKVLQNNQQSQRISKIQQYAAQNNLGAQYQSMQAMQNSAASQSIQGSYWGTHP